MNKMQAAVLHDFNELRLEEVPVPECSDPGDVVIEVRSCGFCQTDYKAITGARRNVEFPCILGHEPSGVVAEVGIGVKALKPGDEVIVMPSAFCGTCPSCRVGNTHYCDHAYTTGGDGPPDVRPGAFAQFMKTSHTSVFRKPAAISFDAAALTEPLSGAWKGVIQYSDMRVADTVVVIGVGGIGLLCMMVARAAGAGRLIAIDTSEYTLGNAKRLGATDVIDARLGHVRDRVYEIAPEGPDVIVEAAGPIEAVRLMIELRRRGTRWNVFGITTHEKFELDGGLTHFMEGRMDASFGTTPLAMTNAIRLMQTGLVNTEEIISHRFPLSRIHDAVEAMASPERNKVIVNP